ncbi:MAG: Trk family potassium uptake protein [Phycisphaerae bacterium]|nr:Trk family potassium uptake protein [Phycisphaerae bacterium]
MQIRYENKRLERATIAVNVLSSALVAASFVLLFGFDAPLLPAEWLYGVQFVLLFVFVAEKIVRGFNATSLKEYIGGFWFEIPLLIGLVVMLWGSGRWFAAANISTVRHVAIGIYLVLEVVFKLCRTTVNLAASGRNPTRVLIASFVFLILVGAGLLTLPRAASGERISFVDALFTSTSATCVTGLIVKDTGADFSLPGQIVILSLIQLGGLGIVVFGAVFALLLGQALSLRESVAMQDMLSASTLGRIGNMIAFIFLGTLVFEAIGAVSLYGMWDNAAGMDLNLQHQWFYSIFHSVSAFCNAGFALFDDSLISYQRQWRVFAVIVPLIILGGLGFGVLYDLANIAADRFKKLSMKLLKKNTLFNDSPKRMRLQTKIVLSVSGILILLGTTFILLLEHYTGQGSHESGGLLGAFFQSVTARTAGFNTIDISAMSAPSKFILIILMFIGGSPGSTAGGIKTVTLAVIVISAIATLRKRRDVEIFQRSVGLVVVGRALTVTLLFLVVLLGAGLLLSITESAGGFDFMDIMFETASALGTVGLSTGVTGALTMAGKLIIIAVMLIGRLGPLTLLAVLTFNLKPAKYNYPEEAIIVG